ncbi:hypothetical protein [Streptomyces sp. NPDC087437]|uniref:hypothetical protein n=1 Tax=Streptomyces sp. NPDC087437 TaxID=3365789 RepID=UPI0037FF5AC0
MLGLSAAEDDTAGPAQLALVAASACPVVLVPDDRTPFAVPVRHPSHVTRGLNARHPVEQAVGFAFDTARVRDVRLHAVHTWELPSRAPELPFAAPEEDRATGRLPARADVRVLPWAVSGATPTSTGTSPPCRPVSPTSSSSSTP